MPKEIQRKAVGGQKKRSLGSGSRSGGQSQLL